MMRKSRCTEGQIAQTLEQVEGGGKVKDVCRELGISDATHHRWKPKDGSMEAADARRLKELEAEKTPG